jgi:hypothetical protein
MKSLLKTIVVAAGVAIVSVTVVVVVQPSRQPHKKVTPPANALESELPTAISNYSKTFKLNTNPPLWTTPANGRSTTN